MQEIFFFDQGEGHLPREKVRIEHTRAEQYPDGRRVRVTVVLTPFSEKPNLSLIISNSSGETVAEAELLEITVDFLQRAHHLDLTFSPRDGIHIVRYALKRLAQEDAEHPLAVDQAWAESLQRVLGEEALDLDRLAAERQQNLGEALPTMDFQDFFFEEDDPLHPDKDDDTP